MLHRCSFPPVGCGPVMIQKVYVDNVKLNQKTGNAILGFDQTELVVVPIENISDIIR